MIKGYLKILVLKKLNDSDLTGFDLIQKLAEPLGRRPSPGSIYPLLNDLSMSGDIDKRKEGRKIIYSLTPEGKNVLGKILKEKEELLIKTIGMFKLLGKFTEESEVYYLNKLIEQFKSKGELFLRNIDLWVELKDVLIKIVLRGDYATDKQKQVRKILKSTVKKLKKLEN